MKRLMQQLWQEDDGVLTFEWVLLVTVLVIGVVGGLAAARDAIIDELGDVAQATINFNQSYSIAGITIPGVLVLPNQQFIDTPSAFTDCNRVTNVPGQSGQVDGANGVDF